MKPRYRITSLKKFYFIVVDNLMPKATLVEKYFEL